MIQGVFGIFSDMRRQSSAEWLKLNGLPFCQRFSSIHCLKTGRSAGAPGQFFQHAAGEEAQAFVFQGPGQGAGLQTAQEGDEADDAFPFPVPDGGEHADGMDGASQFFPYFPDDGVPGVLSGFHLSAGEFIKSPLDCPAFFLAPRRRVPCAEGSSIRAQQTSRMFIMR